MDTEVAELEFTVTRAPHLGVWSALAKHCLYARTQPPNLLLRIYYLGNG